MASAYSDNVSVRPYIYVGYPSVDNQKLDQCLNCRRTYEKRDNIGTWRCRKAALSRESVYDVSDEDDENNEELTYYSDHYGTAEYIDLIFRMTENRLGHKLDAHERKQIVASTRFEDVRMLYDTHECMYVPELSEDVVQFAVVDLETYKGICACRGTLVKEDPPEDCFIVLRSMYM